MEQYEENPMDQLYYTRARTVQRYIQEENKQKGKSLEYKMEQSLVRKEQKSKGVRAKLASEQQRRENEGEKEAKFSTNENEWNI